MWTNISAYKFLNMPEFEELREPLKEFCDSHGIYGTILLSPEGINIFLSAPKEKIDIFVEHIKSDERFSDIWVKYSESEDCAFRKMNVRLKKEIISLGVPGVKPHEFTGKPIAPNEFKKWLDEGKEVTILDTRNDYEIRIGTFQTAMDLDIKTFRDFPRAVGEMAEDLKDKPVVMFCTGGIRCEKASTVMMDAGFSNVKQLKGGVLGYFEEVGGEHWNGDCFVFDRRVALNAELKETDVVQCFACREPLLMEDQITGDYVIAQSCPYCIENE